MCIYQTRNWQAGYQLAIIRLMKKYLILILIFVISAITFFPGKGQAAEHFSFSEKAVWELKSDSSVQVTSTIEVTNLTDSYYATGFEFYLPAKSITNLSAHYSTGDSVNVDQSSQSQTVNGLSYNYIKISLNFPKQIIGLGNNFQVNLNYQMTGALEQKGQTYELVLPNFSDTQVNKTITVKAPSSFGTVNFLSDDPIAKRSDSNYNYYTFGNNQLTGVQQTLVFGDQMSRQLVYNYPLENLDILPSFFKFYLPQDNDRQTVYLRSVEPVPITSAHLDNGNNYLYFFLWPGQKIEVKATIEVLTNVQLSDFDKTGLMSEIPSNLNEYLAPTKYWQTTDPEVRAKAADLIQSNDTVFNNAARVYDFVDNTLSYSQEKANDSVRLGAKAVLARPDYAVCQEYADLMVTLLRAGGIPAREKYGLTDNQELRSSEDNILHAWVEVYLPRFGWLAADPTWGEAGLKFGKMAFDHLTIDEDTGDDLNRPIVLRNNRPYDFGQIYVANVTMTDITNTASGSSLPLPNVQKEKLMDNNRTYLLYFLGVLVVIIITFNLARTFRQKSNTKIQN